MYLGADSFDSFDFNDADLFIESGTTMDGGENVDLKLLMFLLNDVEFSLMLKIEE